MIASVMIECRLTSSFINRDLNIFRMECLAEFEERSKGKLDFLVKDSDKWRVLYLDVRHELENFKVEVHNKEIDYQGTLEDLSSNYQLQISLLQQKLTEKNDALDDTYQISVRLQKMQRENEEFQIRNKFLSSELERYESIISTKDANQYLELHNLKKQLAEKDVIAQNFQSEIMQLKKREVQLQDEHRHLVRYNDELQNENLNLRAEANKLISRLDSASHQFTSERNDVNFAFAKERTGYEQKMKHFSSIINEKEFAIESLHAQTLDLNARIAEAEQSHTNIVQKLKDEISRNERVYFERINEVERVYQSQASQNETEIRELVHSVDTHKQINQTNEATITQLRLQNQCLAQETSGLQNDYSALKDLEKKSEEGLRVTEDRASKLEIDIHAMSKREEELHLRIRSLQDHVVELERKVIQIQDDHDVEIKRLETQSSESRNQLTRSHKNQKQITEQMEKLRSEKDILIAKLIDGMKMLKEGYKLKMSALQQELSKVQLEQTSLKKSLENDNFEAQLQIKDMFKRQKDFASLLKDEGLIS